MTRLIRIAKLVSVHLALLLLTAPVFGQTLKILPLGNSITQGWMGYEEEGGPSQGERIGYRLQLYNQLNQAGYNFDLVGGENAGWSVMSDDDHAGWPSIRDHEVADIMETGYTTNYGYQATQAYLYDYPADIILLHIGTNDVWGNDLNGGPSVERILDAVDEYEISTGNDVLVLLAKIISTRGSSCTSNSKVNTYNNSVVTMAQTRINNDDDKIIIVDMQCGATIDYTDDMFDYWHPNESGYSKMGQKWFDVIDAINSKPVIGTIPNQTIDEGETFNSINLDSYIYDAETSDANMDWDYIQAPGSELEVSINASRQVTVNVPATNWYGSETIKFYAFDDGEYIEKLKKSSDTTEVVFTVLPVDHAPVIDSLVEPVTVDEDSSIAITLADLAVTDVDNDYPEEHTLTISSGTHYTLDGNIIIPDADYNGILSVPLTVTDIDEMESNIFNATITVEPVNDPPEINEPENLSARVAQLYCGSVEIIDLDVGDTPVLSIVQVPGWLEVNTTTRILSGTPTEGDIGNNWVKLEVSDGFASVEKEFQIVVDPYSGTDELVNPVDVFIYPNPAQEHMTISFSNRVKESELSVYSTSGKLMFADKVYNKKELFFNLEEMNIGTGVYVVSLFINHSELLHFKLVVRE